MGRSNHKNVPSAGQIADPGKHVPKLAAEFDGKVVWRFSRVRHSHRNVGWDQATADELAVLRKKLCEWEQRDLRTFVDGRRIESVRVRTLDTRRKALLREAFLDEDLPDTVIRMKVGNNRCRVWVNQVGNCFEFLWWDPDHWVTPD